MSLWNLGGMNPSYKDFVEKHPNKTLIGMAWAQYWRFFVLVLGIELAIVLLLIILT